MAIYGSFLTREIGRKRESIERIHGLENIVQKEVLINNYGR